MTGNMIHNVPSDNIKTDFSNGQKRIKPVTVSTKSSNKLSDIKTSKKIKATYDYQYDSYSNTDLSSKGNIYMNKIAYDITNVLKNELTSEEFKTYKQYIIGKQIRELIDKNGNLKPINNIENNNIIDSINDKIVKLKNSNKIHYDKVLLNSFVKEIVNESNGFDALVLENENEYYVISTCCDSQSKEDVLAISYALLYQITGSDKVWSSLSSLLVNDKGKIGKFSVKELTNGSKYYHRQRNSNINLIQKYVNKGKKLRLGGYSLGGGIMLDSYARLCYENPTKYEDTTLTLFNPFMSYLEIDSKKQFKRKQQQETIKIMQGNKLLDVQDFFKPKENLADAVEKASSKVLIYSTEGDTVSQFNALTNKFQKQIVYLKGNQKINENINEITDIINFVIGENSRHGFNGIDNDSFDHNGYLLETGNQITVNEIAGGYKSTNNLSVIVSTIIDKHFQKTVGDYINSLPKNQEWMANDFKDMYFDLRHYFIDNAGHYDADSMIKIVSPSLTNLLKKGAEKETVVANIPNFFISKDKVEKTLHDYVHTAEGKKQLRYILDSFMYGDIEQGINHLNEFVTTIYYNIDVVKLLSEIISEYNTGYQIGQRINNKSDHLIDDISKKTL